MPHYEQAKQAVTAMNIDTIAESIRDFVGKHYGEGELDNPAWDIDALAAHLAKRLP